MWKRSKQSLTNLKNAYKRGIFYKGLENIDLNA